MDVLSLTAFVTAVVSAVVGAIVYSRLPGGAERTGAIGPL